MRILLRVDRVREEEKGLTCILMRVFHKNSILRKRTLEFVLGTSGE